MRIAPATDQLAKHAKKLDGHLLTPWLEYWRVSLRLEDASRARFVNSCQSTPIPTPPSACAASGCVLGRRGEWAEFEREAAAGGEDELESAATAGCAAWSRATTAPRRGQRHLGRAARCPGLRQARRHDGGARPDLDPRHLEARAPAVQAGQITAIRRRSAT
jgi:hypothetical protein